MEQKKRLYLWDNMKFLLILLVVMGHFMDEVMSTFEMDSPIFRSFFLAVYTFHMPAFLFISGLFSKRTVQERRWCRLFDYFVLYVFVKAALTMCSRLNGGTREFRLSEGSGMEWFAWALLICTLLTILLRNFDPAYVLCFAVVLGCLAGYQEEQKTWFATLRVMNFYPFFYLGYLLDPKKLPKLLKKPAIQVASAALLIGFAAFCYTQIDKIYWLRLLMTGQWAYTDLAHVWPMAWTLRLGHYVFACMLIAALIALIPDKKSIFTVWGGRSLNVYALHGIARWAFMRSRYGATLIMNQFPNYPEPMVFLVAVVVTIVLSLPVWVHPMDVLLHPKWRNPSDTKYSH